MTTWFIFLAQKANKEEGNELIYDSLQVEWAFELPFFSEPLFMLLPAAQKNAQNGVRLHPFL